MCESNLLIDRRTLKPIEVPPTKHRLVYTDILGREHVLLDDFQMPGRIDYAAAHAVKDCHGMKRGYLFAIGEAESKPENPNA